MDDILNEYNNTYHRRIKMKTIDVKKSPYIDFEVENSNKNTKLKVSDCIGVLKYKNIFVKGYTLNLSEVFVIKKVKNTVPLPYMI